MIPKTQWRKILSERRKSIPQNRREEAATLLLQHLKSRGKILSFKPIGSEINVTPLNNYLLLHDRLAIVPYKANTPIDVPLTGIDCILVPGLGFDSTGYRIGYGKGIYDQFLAKVGKIITIGVGFKEQLCEESLPRDPWDIPVKELLLV